MILVPFSCYLQKLDPKVRRGFWTTSVKHDPEIDWRIFFFRQSRQPTESGEEKKVTGFIEDNEELDEWRGRWGETRDPQTG